MDLSKKKSRVQPSMYMGFSRESEQVSVLVLAICTHGLHIKFPKCITFNCCDKTPWPKQFLEEFIWIYSLREIRVHPGGEAWQQEGMAPGTGS